MTAALADLDVAESDVPYANPGGVELLARVYRPSSDSDAPYPTLISVHGGAWNANHRIRNEPVSRVLASSGLVIVSLDFRQGPDHQHPCATSDIVAGVRWAKLHAAEFGGDPGSVGMIGNSSGGHLALLAAVRPRIEEHRQTPLLETASENEEGVDGSVRYVVACWPVSDPLYRYRYAVRMERDGLVTSSLAYFGDEATMREASVPRILDDGEAQELPPVLIVQPGEDQNVPLEMTQYLMRAYQQRGGHLEYAYFPGEPHAFTYEASDATEQCLALITDFIHRRAR